MTMGLSMALHEQSVLRPAVRPRRQPRPRRVPHRRHADVRDLEAIWLDEDDDARQPDGLTGIGEIGIVGAAAAVANAVYHATGIRVRDLPVTCDKLLT